MKFSSKLYIHFTVQPPPASMALRNSVWFSRIVFLVSVACFGPCTARGGGQPELFIFNELCALKMVEGPCKAIKERFYFDIDTGRCERFDFGGCGGNANNFGTLEACEEMCVVSVDKSPCHLEEAPGPCRGLLTRYFFDTGSQECKHFFYGGCFGNANNFKSMAACQEKCQNPVAVVTTKVPKVVTANPTGRPSATPRRVTEELVLTLPQVRLEAPQQPAGESSLMDFHQQPTDFSPPEFCLSHRDRGSCTGAQRRFAYNPSTRKCHLFRYSGCGGNENNFTHKRHCMKMCMNIRNLGTRMIRIRKKNFTNIVFRHV